MESTLYFKIYQYSYSKTVAYFFVSILGHTTNICIAFSFQSEKFINSVHSVVAAVPFQGLHI